MIFLASIGVFGLGIIIYGLWLIYPPLSYLFIGIMLLGIPGIRVVKNALWDGILEVRGSESQSDGLQSQLPNESTSYLSNRNRASG